MPTEFRKYRKSKIAEGRPYMEGEDLGGISVSERDTPGPGGMIFRDPSNPEDQWYVNASFFTKNYELAE